MKKHSLPLVITLTLNWPTFANNAYAEQALDAKRSYQTLFLL